MKLGKFCKIHKEELNDLITKRYGYASKTQADRKDFVLNDEELYNWARSEGVKI